MTASTTPETTNRPLLTSSVILSVILFDQAAATLLSTWGTFPRTAEWLLRDADLRGITTVGAVGSEVLANLTKQTGRDVSAVTIQNAGDGKYRLNICAWNNR